MRGINWIMGLAVRVRFVSRAELVKAMKEALATAAMEVNSVASNSSFSQTKQYN